MINLLSPRNKEEADCFYKILIHSIQEIEGNDNCEYSITWKTVHKQRGLTKTYKTAKKGKFLKFSYQKEGQTSVEIHEPFELFSHFSVSSMYSPEQKVTFSLCEHQNFKVKEITFVSLYLADFTTPYYSDETSMKLTLIVPFDNSKLKLKLSFTSQWANKEKQKFKYIVVEKDQDVNLELPEVKFVNGVQNFVQLKNSSSLRVKNGDLSPRIDTKDSPRTHSGSESARSPQERSLNERDSPSTPRKFSEEASEFVQKLKELKTEISKLTHEKKELKDKLDHAVLNSTSNDSVAVSELKNTLVKVKKEQETIQENQQKVLMLVKEMKERLNYFSLEKEGLQGISHNIQGNIVTIVYCDIQGTPGLWQLPRDKFKECIQIYIDCIKERANECLGYINPSETDSIIISFASIRKAIKFCLLTQIKLMEANWPKELLETESQPDLFKGIRCRMGIDSGNAEYIVDDYKRIRYIGDVVHKSSVIANYTLGGQVIISESAWVCLNESKEKSDSPIRSVVQDMSTQELKGLERKEHLRLIVPEIFKGRRYKKDQLTLVINDSSSIIYLSQEISKIRATEIENLQQNLNSLNSKISNSQVLFSFCHDLAEKKDFEKTFEEFKNQQKKLVDDLDSCQKGLENFKSKLSEIEISMSKLTFNLFTNEGQSNNQNNVSTPNMTPRDLTRMPSFIQDFKNQMNLNEKNLKMDTEKNCEILQKMLELTYEQNIQLEEQLKDFEDSIEE